ncbi:MAG: NAD(P)H:quinone oxidoreductase [Sulfobacillus sp.]
MADLKVAVIYYSAMGTNYGLAQAASDAAREAGAEVRLRRVRELAPAEAIAANAAWQAHHEATRDAVPQATLDDLDWADAYIFSMPTRFGNMAAQMKQFLDTAGPLWGQGKLANKAVTAMTSAQNAHGGQESTLLSFYVTMYHWGAIVVAPGYTDPTVFAAGGNPYGTSASQPADGQLGQAELAAARYQAKRLVDIARKLVQ